jgi:hypothetical protein
MWRHLCLFFCLMVISASSQEKPKPENFVPVISGDIGSCTAEFTVTGTKLKPIYKAKLEVELRYGFGGFHRTSLEIYTNVNGRARVEGLPERSKRALAFTVSYEGRKTVVMVDPEAKCHGSYNAIVTDNPVKTDGDE